MIRLRAVWQDDEPQWTGDGVVIACYSDGHALHSSLIRIASSNSSFYAVAAMLELGSSSFRPALLYWNMHDPHLGLPLAFIAVSILTHLPSSPYS